MVRRGIIDAKRFLQDAIEMQSRYEAEIESIVLDPQFLKEHELEAQGRRVAPNSTISPLAEFLLPKHPCTRTKIQHDLVYTITFYPPRSSHRHSIKQQQYQFLGSQTLYCLRDHCFCLSDHILVGNEQEPRRQPSSFVFIENRFYVDDRTDFEDVLDTLGGFWSDIEEAHPQLNPMAHQTMDTRLIDIPLRIDQLYLLHHQYSCGHAFKVNEIRLHHELVDHVYEEQFPFVLYFDTISLPTCAVCKLCPPCKVAYGCYKGPYDGSLWCQTCINTHYPDMDLELYSYELDAEFTSLFDLVSIETGITSKEQIGSL
jgi:hypothetical protein